MQTRTDTGRSGRTPSHCLGTANQLIVIELKPEPVEVLVPSQRTPCSVLASVLDQTNLLVPLSPAGVKRVVGWKGKKKGGGGGGKGEERKKKKGTKKMGKYKKLI